MDRTIGSTPLSLTGVGALVGAVVGGLVLAALTPTTGGLLGPGVLAVAFALAAFIGLAKTSSA